MTSQAETPPIHFALHTAVPVPKAHGCNCLTSESVLDGERSTGKKHCACQQGRGRRVGADESAAAQGWLWPTLSSIPKIALISSSISTWKHAAPLSASYCRCQTPTTATLLKPEREKTWASSAVLITFLSFFFFFPFSGYQKCGKSTIKLDGKYSALHKLT